MGAAKIEIKKRNFEELVCWKICGEDIAPNTVLESENGITLLVNADGKSKVCMKNSTTVFGLFNPGKTTKLIGGSKPYESCEICAIDQTSEFDAEWGLGGVNAIPCQDKEYGVDCSAVAYGNYYYKVDDFFNFYNSVPFGNNGELTKGDIREFLRSETTGIIKNYLASELMKKGVKTCQANISLYSAEIMEEINKHLESKGITVYNFVILKLDYEPRYKAQRAAINDTKMFVNLKKVANDGSRDDISVESEKTSKVIVPLVRAVNDIEHKNKEKTDSGNEYVFCSRCGEKNNKPSNFCYKCGEKLNK